MKSNHYIFSAAALTAAALLTASCKDFIEETPDARITIDSESKVLALLNSAYPQSTYVRITELASDNADDYGGDENGYADLFAEQCYRWQDITESDNENSAQVWQGFYAAIGAANQALAAIDEMGGATTDNLRAAQGEALLCRAYGHFMLVNIFAQHYSTQHADTDPGIPYITEPETTLKPDYERFSVAKVYELVEKDLLEGLEKMNDAIYEVPRYHFNAKAAYTFASRFYLFKGDAQQAVKYATLALGSDPASLLRDYSKYDDLATTDTQYRAMQYCSSSETANFLLCPTYSNDYFYWSAYGPGLRFNFTGEITEYETLFAAPWCSDKQIQEQYRSYFFNVTGNSFDFFPKNPYYFEETNATAHTGYYRSIFVAFKAEEAILNRAEAYALQGNEAAALADLNLWSGNFYVDSITYNTGNIDWSAIDWSTFIWGVDPYPYIYETAICHNHLQAADVTEWYQKYQYYTPSSPTPLRHLHPEFVSLSEGSSQEQLLQTILLARRMEFMQEGMRWFDVKRYGIKIYRREFNTSLGKMQLTDSLSYRDDRAALQIPFEVRSAGLEGNARPAVSTANQYQSWLKGTSAAEIEQMRQQHQQ